MAALLGAWLVAAPFALGYDGAPRATANDVAVGAAVVLLAVLGLTLRRRVRGGPTDGRTGVD